MGQKTITKFADNTKSLRHVENHADLQKLQPTLEKGVKLSDTWSMSFYVDKSNVMHIVSNSPQREYKMRCKSLAKTELEKDVGVYLNKNLKH